jgi:hypothetical protein
MINQQDQSNLGRFHRRNFLSGISLSFISTALGTSRGSAQESPSRGAPELVTGLIVRQ